MANCLLKHRKQSLAAILVCLACGISLLTLASLKAEDNKAKPKTKMTENDRYQKFIQPAIKTHCIKCHGAGDEIEGDLNFLKIKNTNSLAENIELVRKLIDVIDLKEMPPEDEPQFSPKLHKQLLTELKTILHTSVSKNRSISHTPIRRMNRFQYNNAVQDLFQLKCVVFSLPERMLRDHSKYFDPASGKMPKTVRVGSRPLGKSQLIERRLEGVGPFPQDLRAENGYDNRGDHLSLSPLLLESFLSLSRSIVNSPDFTPKTCGIWNDFFAPPQKEKNLKNEVRNRLRSFLTLAFRRPIEEKSLNRYVKFVMSHIQSGKSFTNGMKAAASAVLASPRFLYLYDLEEEDDKIKKSLNSFDLASRLSFFLWGSIPDQTLLNLATDGSLNDPKVLSKQVDRMMKDKRLKRFCDSFPSQWLQLDRIISSTPDQKHFPEFYFLGYRTSMHMMLEPLLLFETILIEDRPILDLIDSDFSYRSEILERFSYGTGKKIKKTNPGILSFKRVKLTDRSQGGMITNVAVMTMTSGTERTKPITRGSWIAYVIFNNPPDPPPANVPSLPDDAPKGEENLTLRERLSAHRERADCAGCHEQIDPLGFALENYNPIGKWRDKYKNGRKIEMKGTLFQTHEFKNIGEFKDAILIEKDRFTRAFTSHVLSFALAREIKAADSLAVEKIAHKTASDNYKMKTLIKQVILSEPFLRKSNPKTSALPTTKNSPHQRSGN